MRAKKIMKNLAAIALVAPMALGSTVAVSANSNVNNNNYHTKITRVAHLHSHKHGKHLIHKNHRNHTMRLSGRYKGHHSQNYLTRAEVRDNHKVTKATIKMHHDYEILHGKTLKHNHHALRKARRDYKHQLKVLNNTPSYDHLSKKYEKAYRRTMHRFYKKVNHEVKTMSRHHKSHAYKLGLRNALNNVISKRLVHNKNYRAGYIRGIEHNDKILYKSRRENHKNAIQVYNTDEKHGLGTGSVADQYYNNFAQKEFVDSTK